MESPSCRLLGDYGKKIRFCLPDSFLAYQINRKAF